MEYDIFRINSEAEFREACLQTFRYQYQNVEIYKKFVDLLNIDPNEILEINKIPFLPIEMFKNHQVLDKNAVAQNYFQSSGTTEITLRSKHYIADFALYEDSICQSFKQFIGKPEEYIFLALLPNYSINPHSSLIYMVDFLMKKSGKVENGYFLIDYEELYIFLKELKNQKIILFGVSFALLDFLDFCSVQKKEIRKIKHLTIIETGGMKGRKEEMTKDELLNIFKNGFKTDKIFSEYSMTELLSQAYSHGGNIYESPNWMRILIRNAEDPFSYVEKGKTGAVNIIDLANRHTCSFIATQDLGKITEINTNSGIHKNKFKILGRIDHSDIRGCSLLVS